MAYAILDRFPDMGRVFLALLCCSFWRVVCCLPVVDADDDALWMMTDVGGRMAGLVSDLMQLLWLRFLDGLFLRSICCGGRVWALVWYGYEFCVIGFFIVCFWCVLSSIPPL